MAQLWLLVGIAVGGLGAWIALRARVVALQADTGELPRLRSAHAASERELAETRTALDHERRAGDEKLRLLERARDELKTTFEALSADALRTAFLDLARAQLGQRQVQAKEDLEARTRVIEQLVKLLGEQLGRVDGKLEQLERARREAQGGLSEHLRQVSETQERLRVETGNLVTALRSPVTRGRWGEIQLRRVCELAGMLPYCDFVEQATIRTVDGRLRPDLIVRLPGDKDVVVDAKAPLAAYLDALNAGDDGVRRAQFEAYGRHMRDHVAKLSAKSYWSQFDSTPEFVVMFLPSEALFSAALEQVPDLIEEGVAQSVLLATPTTLIALLRAVAYGWRQERVAESARAVGELGKELHGRIGVLLRHFAKLGRQLDGSVRAYNETVGSLEGRVLPTARKFEQNGAAPEAAELGPPTPIEAATRAVQAAELDGGGEIELRRLPESSATA